MLAYPFETQRIADKKDPIRSMTPKPKKGMVKRGAWEVTKKLLKAIPVIGTVFTIGFAGNDIKKKGLVPGAVHVGLDVTPVVGTAKSVVEIFTGDLIPDKPPKNQLRQNIPGPGPTIG